MKTLRISTLAVTAGLLALSACTSIDTPTNDPRTRTNEGIALGAATGVVMGLLGGDNVKERRNAAIVGGIVGGAIGADLDKQAAELQASLGDSRIRVINKGDYLIVRMPQDILFAVDSTRVNGALRSDLAAVAANLNRYPGSTVEVVGHTDKDGSAAYNLDLSRRRALAVADILIANGVAPGRVHAIGMGEDQPIATNYTAAGKAQNRRVEILIRPNG